MARYFRSISCVMIFVWLLLVGVAAFAAPDGSTLQNMRYRQKDDKVRVVLDFDKLPEYNVVLEAQPLRLIIEMTGSLKQDIGVKALFNDPFVKGVTLEETEPGHIRAVVDLKQNLDYHVFVLKSPNRIVIDLNKVFEQKAEEELIPGVRRLSWKKSYPFGPVEADVVTIDPVTSGVTLVPVLSNNAISGLETLSNMSSRVKALAAINGSYFSLSGEIIGLLKLNGEIVSTPTLPRTAVGIMPDGTLLIDQAEYNGECVLPDGTFATISGVNRERGADEIILYNKYYGPTTGTNSYGIDVVVDENDRVTAVNGANTPITPGSRVLSGHGQGKNLLKNLHVGDRVLIHETLGAPWDKTIYALGAGPMLVKDGSVNVTAEEEQVASDIAIGRAPRTALGVMQDGKILLAVVDGRRAGSAGFTLGELAAFMRDLGAVNALNLDGGGSSEMIVNGVIVNTPSDGRERRVGDAIAVVRTSLVN